MTLRGMPARLFPLPFAAIICEALAKFHFHGGM